MDCACQPELWAYDSLMQAQLPRWLPTEDALLQKWLDANVETAEIALKLGRTAQAVMARQKRIGVTPSARAWTQTEDGLVEELSQFMTDAQLGQLIGRSRQAVAHRRTATLGMANETPAPWSAEELRVLTAAFPLMPADDVAAMLPRRTRKAVVGMAHLMGLRRRHLANLPGGHVPLPPELREVIRLAKDLRKGIADEERRRSAGVAVRGIGSAERQAGSGGP